MLSCSPVTLVPNHMETFPRHRKSSVIKIVKDQYEPAPLVIAKHYQFYQRSQDTGESIADYVTELRCLVTKCKFEETTDFLEDSLRDRRRVKVKERCITQISQTTPHSLHLARNCCTRVEQARERRSS